MNNVEESVQGRVPRVTAPFMDEISNAADEFVTLDQSEWSQIGP